MLAPHRPVIRNNGLNWEMYESMRSGFNDEVRYFIPENRNPCKEEKRFCVPRTAYTKLKEQLSLIDRVIIVGWNAADEYVLKLLEVELKSRNIPIIIVSYHSSEQMQRKFAMNTA